MYRVLFIVSFVSVMSGVCFLGILQSFEMVVQWCCLMLLVLCRCVAAQGNGGTEVDRSIYIPKIPGHTPSPPFNVDGVGNRFVPSGANMWNTEQQSNLNNIMEHSLFTPLITHVLNGANAAATRFFTKMKSKNNLVAAATQFYHNIAADFITTNDTTCVFEDSANDTSSCRLINLKISSYNDQRFIKTTTAFVAVCFSYLLVRLLFAAFVAVCCSYLLVRLLFAALQLGLHFGYTKNIRDAYIGGTHWIKERDDL